MSDEKDSDKNPDLTPAGVQEEVRLSTIDELIASGLGKFRVVRGFEIRRTTSSLSDPGKGFLENRDIANAYASDLSANSANSSYVVSEVVALTDGNTCFVLRSDSPVQHHDGEKEKARMKKAFINSLSPEKRALLDL